MAAARGAYAIICQDGRAYVGGSKSIIRRWAGHKSLLSGKKHPNRKLQTAWIEQGSEAFTFVVLEIVSPNADLIAVEQKWIDTLDSAKTGFNLAPNAGSSLGHKLTAEMRQHLSDVRRGKPKSAAHRAAISVSKSGEKSRATKLHGGSRTPSLDRQWPAPGHSQHLRCRPHGDTRASGNRLWALTV